jgi:tetratricopeptide (TPR) repeat protein
MKKQFITAILVTFATVAFAGSNFGIDYYCLGELNLAKAYFEKQVSQVPSESNYYLGEIAFKEGKTDEAKAFYEKGIAADPLYMLNYIGKGKTMLKSDRVGAELVFAAAMKKNKKNIPLNIAVARAYYENGIKDVAQAKLLLAKKFGKNSPLVYIFEGDILRDEKKLGDAAGKYEQAMYFDKENTVAQIKYAQVYESINPNLSVETLKKVINAHPDYTVAYRDLGISFGLNGQYNSAIEAFKIYFAEGNYNIDDIVRFASAYYFTDQYPESIQLINEGLKKDSTNFVLNRLKMYNAAKTKDKDNGLNYANYFFSLKSNTGFIYQDYAAYAAILADAGKYTESMDQYNKVLNTEGIEVNKAEIYKEMAPIYNKMGDYLKAAEKYQQIIDLAGPDNAESSNFYLMGRAYYLGGIAMRSDTTETGKEKFKECMTKADSAFSTVCRMTPDSHIGFMWRGHTNAALDPETTLGLAKPFYENAVSIILKKMQDGGSNGFAKDLLKCYEWLGVYYFKKDDKENAMNYWTKVLELDPKNVNANAIMNEYKAPVKK